MKIVFSRKGFDSTYGGAPSPIVEGRPVSLPIPGGHGEVTTYSELGLGALVRASTRGRIQADHACHDDPMVSDGFAWLGQTGSAQGHLHNQAVGEGDVFLFFGLFADPQTGERHHRIFGYLEIACHGSPTDIVAHPRWSVPPRPHPHFSGDWGSRNAIYHGPGGTARTASPGLRLTRPGGPLNSWIVPPWLKRRGLSYHANPERWTGATGLNSAKRGQEFVCDIGRAKAPRLWLNRILDEINR